MKKAALMLIIFTLASCAGKEKDPSKTNTGIPGYDTTLPRNRILNRLKNTRWQIPSYPEANIAFDGEGVTLAMNKSYILSNARASIVEEERDFLVFTVDDLTNSVLLSLRVKDKDTLSIAAHASGGTDPIAERHDILAQDFKRIN